MDKNQLKVLNSFGYLGHLSPRRIQYKKNKKIFKHAF